MILTILLSLSVQAATPNAIQAEEILSLPSANRRMLAQDQDTSQLWEGLRETAFNEQASIQNRWKALNLMAELKPSLSLTEIDKALVAKEWFMRNAGLVALSKISADRAHEAGLKLLKDRALVVRSAAVAALKPKLSEEDRIILWNELNQEYNFRKKQSLWVRSEILARLAFEPKKSEFRLFVQGLKDADESMHDPAIQALEKLTEKKFKSPKNKSSEVRKKWLSYLSKTTIL